MKLRNSYISVCEPPIKNQDHFNFWNLKSWKKLSGHNFLTRGSQRDVLPFLF